MVERFEALKRGFEFGVGIWRGATPRPARDRAMCSGRGAAAAADDVDEPAGRELAEQLAGGLRLLVVLAEGVRQAGVRIAR